jgi:DNA polymerase-3 subunit delta'
LAFAFEQIASQVPALTTLKRALETGQVAHAYLFEGPSGVGKMLAARALAEALLCDTAPNRGCGQCHACERVRQDKHPDVRIFAPRDEGNRNLQVETVRNEIVPFAKFAPFEGRAAVLIFPESDVSFPEMHPEAANALLKTLEEPRQALTFVLLSERPERLLATIRSRCQTVRFGPLPSDTLRSILTKHGIPDAQQPAAIALSQGRADRALELAQEGRAQELVELALAVDDAAHAGKIAALLDLAEQLAGRDDRELVLETLALFYRDVAAAAIDPEIAPAAFPEQRALISERAQRLGARAAAESVHSIFHVADTLERNANPETALDAMLLGLAYPDVTHTALVVPKRKR